MSRGDGRRGASLRGIVVAVAAVVLSNASIAEPQASATSPEAASTAAGTFKRVRRQAIQMVLADADQKGLTTTLPGAEPAASQADEVVQLEPFRVSEERAPDLSTPRETPTEKFFRTGTFLQHTGRKFTTKLWMKGDEGLMLRFSW